MLLTGKALALQAWGLEFRIPMLWKYQLGMAAHLQSQHMEGRDGSTSKEAGETNQMTKLWVQLETLFQNVRGKAIQEDT